MHQNRITRVRLKHCRSIRACDVSLGPLTFLVGPTGSGKSNFLDALRLVADGLTSSLDQALRERRTEDSTEPVLPAARDPLYLITAESMVAVGPAAVEVIQTKFPMPGGLVRINQIILDQADGTAPVVQAAGA